MQDILISNYWLYHLNFFSLYSFPTFLSLTIFNPWLYSGLNYILRIKQAEDGSDLSWRSRWKRIIYKALRGNWWVYNDPHTRHACKARASDLLVFRLICELSERHVHSETFDDPLPQIRLGCWFINCVADYLTSQLTCFFISSFKVSCFGPVYLISIYTYGCWLIQDQVKQAKI